MLNKKNAGEPAAQILLTDGTMIELHDEDAANALYHVCMQADKRTLFIPIETQDGIRLIKADRIADIMFYDSEEV